MQYTWQTVPLNTIVWACAYETNNTEKSMGLKKKPVRGIVICEFGRRYFYEVNKKDEKIESKVVKSISRRYADTEEECKEIYNSLVNAQISFLRGLIADCQGDLIE
jgi:hypothetical protein